MKLTHRIEEITKIFDGNTYVGYIDNNYLYLFDAEGYSELVGPVGSVSEAFGIIRKPSLATH